MRRLAVSLATVAALASAARGDDEVATQAPTVLAIPTAWIIPRTAVHVSGDVDHRLGSGARATLAYGRLVEVDVGGDGLVTACDVCGGDARAPRPVQQTTAGWKLGVRPWPGVALAAGVRVPFGRRGEGRATEAFAVASARLGQVRLHAGASTWATSHRGADGGTLTQGALAGVRPLLGVEWTPDIYPRTTLLADLQWLPQLGPTDAETASRWSFSWGVRYRALRWSAIELGVRHRQDDALGDATVMVRLSALLSANPR